MSRHTQESRELALQNRLREIDHESWATESSEKLSELKDERRAIELELREIRVSLYLSRHVNG